MSSPPLPEPVPPRLPWHVIYYLLAAFNILIVCGSLYLNYRVTDLYVHAVASNQEWGQLMADYLALERLAAEANAAGNDVFESQAVARESQRMRAAAAAFDERLAALRKDLEASAPPASAPSLLDGLQDIDQAMRRMVAEAGSVFGTFDRRDGAAPRHMAAMDRCYAELLTAFREQRTRFGVARAPRPVRAPEPESVNGLKLQRWERFERQTSRAASLQRWEWVIAGLVAMMIAAAVLYGRHLARQMDEDVRERARYIEALSEAHANLEKRVLERTEALRSSEAELRRAAAEWQQTFEAIESPVLLVDLEGRIVRANRAASEQAGLSDLAGRSLDSLGAAEPWRTAARLVARVAEARSSATAEVRDAASRRIWDMVANLVTHHGSGDRAILVARDITSMVELQEKVRREERMSAMGSLVAGVAHEVRNPLFGISGTLETLSARLGPSETLAKYFAMLKRDVVRLRALMQDLLDYGRPARLALAPTSLGAIVAEAVRSCEPLAEGLRVEARVADGLPAVCVDRARMVQVFENLVRNALQHSPAGGDVIIEAGRLDPRSVWCSVRDFGPGFREQDLPRLFEPFFTKREGGTGLGLSIAQRIVEQHGGRLEAENHPEGGAVVRMTLGLGAVTGEA